MCKFTSTILLQEVFHNCVHPQEVANKKTPWGWVGEINNKDDLSPAEAVRWAELSNIDSQDTLNIIYSNPAEMSHSWSLYIVLEV